MNKELVLREYLAIEGTKLVNETTLLAMFERGYTFWLPALRWVRSWKHNSGNFRPCLGCYRPDYRGDRIDSVCTAAKNN
jgi:hypothetical protein